MVIFIVRACLRQAGKRALNLLWYRAGFVTLTERPFSWFATGKPTMGIAQGGILWRKKRVEKNGGNGYIKLRNYWEKGVQHR
ncbi:MAG: hypothetical protein ABSH06_08795 [Thermodesulfobacteriota bacterium]